MACKEVQNVCTVVKGLRSPVGCVKVAGESVAGHSDTAIETPGFRLAVVSRLQKVPASKQRLSET